MRLENKVAVVTGASSGVGREIALLFAKEGHHILHGGASVQKHGVPVLDLLHCQLRNAPLFPFVVKLPLEQGRKMLFRHRLHPTVAPLNQSRRLHGVKIPIDGGGAGLQDVRKIAHRNVALLIEDIQNLLLPYFLRHFILQK